MAEGTICIFLGADSKSRLQLGRARDNGMHCNYQRQRRELARDCICRDARLKRQHRMSWIPRTRHSQQTQKSSVCFAR